jgi:hypothetical protein
MADALAHLLHAREDALATVQTGVRVAALDPVVGAGYQLDFVVYVWLVRKT